MIRRAKKSAIFRNGRISLLFINRENHCPLIGGNLLDTEENSYLLIENVLNFILEKKSVFNISLYNCKV